MRIKRHKKIRSRISGTDKCPRVCVFRSNRYISAQAVDDVARKTLLSIKGSKTKSLDLGKKFAKEILTKGIEKIVFDRGGHKYHGHVKNFAEGMREGGIKF